MVATASITQWPEKDPIPILTFLVESKIILLHYIGYIVNFDVYVTI